VRDTTAPSVTIITPSADAMLAAVTVDVQVRTTDTVGAAGVTVNGVSAIQTNGTAQSGTWRATVPITLPVAPGGGTDPQARLIGRKFQESMGQPFVIENRTGAGSMIGTEFVVRAPADGYTLLVGASTLAGAPALRKDLAFDMLKDLTPVGQISYTSQFLVVHSSVPVSTVQEFIALAKKQGGKMNAASGGVGSANHLAFEMLKQRAGIQATHIAYKGSGPATIALMSGEVDFSFAGALTSMLYSPGSTGSGVPYSDGSRRWVPRFTTTPAVRATSGESSMDNRLSRGSSSWARLAATRPRSAWPMLLASEAASRNVAQALAVLPMRS